MLHTIRALLLDKSDYNQFQALQIVNKNRNLCDARIVSALIYLTTSFLTCFICPLMQYLNYYFCLSYRKSAIIFIYTKLKCNFNLEHLLIFDLILYQCHICTSIYSNHFYFHYNYHFRIFGSLIIWIIFLIYFTIVKILTIPPFLILFMTTPKNIVIFYQSYIFFHLPYFVTLIIIL